VAKRQIDKTFLFLALGLTFIGFFLFVSASLGLLARDGAKFSTVFFNQVIFGLVGGFLMLYFMSKIDYSFWRKYSFYIFLASIFLSLLVFVPWLGVTSGGAARWVQFGPLPSFQPVEFLKLGFVIYFAAWASGVGNKIKTFQYGLLPLIVVIGLISALLLSQPDTGNLIVIFVTGVTMFFVAGGRWKDMFISFLIGLILFGALVLVRPYLLDRVLTFIKPDTNLQGSSYQINQSFIAIGSGKILGRGFGQSVQKFNYLPEPIGDSIFAVAAEEWGFLGSSILILFFLAFTFRGLKIATKTKDIFGGLLTTGIITLIISQSFLNIASMLGVFPLTGMPLLFVSHGGTALFFTLAEVGIILNISKRVALTN